MIKLNLGAGSDHIDGFINVDIDPNCKPDMVMDAKHLKKFNNNSVDEIVAYHVLEHFSFKEFFVAITEWFRVLKKGGKLIIECPDIEKICMEFYRGDFESRYRSFNEGPPLISHIYGGQVNPYEFHKSGYTKEFLKITLSPLFEIFVFGESHKDYKVPCIRMECNKK